MMTQEEYVSDAVDLLKKLIATPSVSRNEKDAADIMEQTIRKYGFEPHREANNIWIIDPHYDESRPTLLLNAHRYREACGFMDTQPVITGCRRGCTLRFGQQRLRRRTLFAPPAIQNADRKASAV